MAIEHELTLLADTRIVFLPGPWPPPSRARSRDDASLAQSIAAVVPESQAVSG